MKVKYKYNKKAPMKKFLKTTLILLFLILSLHPLLITYAIAQTPQNTYIEDLKSIRKELEAQLTDLRNNGGNEEDIRGISTAIDELTTYIRSISNNKK